jgi:hypothetical protein
MKRILIALLLPIIVHAGQSNSTPKDLTVKIMVEVLRKNASNGSANGMPETLAYAYNTHNWSSGFEANQKKQASDDMKYSIPVFMCSASNVNGIKTWRIMFEAIYDPNPRREERIEEDYDTLIENDSEESSRRLKEHLQRYETMLHAFNAPIAKDNREFSLNEFKEYETSIPNIVVKAGAYNMNN